MTENRYCLNDENELFRDIYWNIPLSSNACRKHTLLDQIAEAVNVTGGGKNS